MIVEKKDQLLRLQLNKLGVTFISVHQDSYHSQSGRFSPKQRHLKWIQSNCWKKQRQEIALCNSPF